MHKFTIYAKPENLITAARVAQRVSAPAYEWPSDGITAIGYKDTLNDEWVISFSVKRNKAGITIWEQDA